jgi:hypothetical protein
MSRAFTKESDSDPPPRRYLLPDRDDPGYFAAAASALLEGARVGDTASAESATGMTFGDPRLVPQVELILADAELADDDRLIQVAERFLRLAVKARPAP